MPGKQAHQILSWGNTLEKDKVSLSKRLALRPDQGINGNDLTTLFSLYNE